MPALESNVLVEAVKKTNTDKGYPIFIETGTLLGDTSAMVSPMVKKVYTIEIDDSLYNKAVDRFQNTNVEVIKGDSLDVLPELLKNNKDNIIFWLDGHNSGPGTGVGKYDFPLLQECSVIDNLLESKEALIIADDIRMFGTGHDFAIDSSLKTITVESILNVFKRLKIVKHWFADSAMASNDRLIIHVALN